MGGKINRFQKQKEWGGKKKEKGERGERREKRKERKGDGGETEQEWGRDESFSKR